MMNREEAEALLRSYIKNENLVQHCQMVAQAMEACARELNKADADIERWWLCGLLHDLDWEMYPDEHPLKATREILPEAGFDEAFCRAIDSHAPGRSNIEPDSEMERYLFACDELSGFMNAVSLMRPNGFDDMKVKSVTKKLKDRKFAENVSREDIQRGAELIGKPLNDHIAFLITVFGS